MPENSLFGCPACFQTEAAVAWDAMRHFPRLARLVDESHFDIQVLQCPQCGQRGVQVFTETIDWAGGDDPQYWSVVPLTPAESEELIAQGKQVDGGPDRSDQPGPAPSPNRFSGQMVPCGSVHITDGMTRSQGPRARNESRKSSEIR